MKVLMRPDHVLLIINFKTLPTLNESPLIGRTDNSDVSNDFTGYR
jgi:hypothetical protein